MFNVLDFTLKRKGMDWRMLNGGGEGDTYY